MLLSSGVIWRHRELENFRAECPGGDPALQETVVEQLDEAIAWLETLGASVLEHETGNPRTIGKRFDTRRLTETLASRAGDVLSDMSKRLTPGRGLTGHRSFWRREGSTCAWLASSGFPSAATRGARETGSTWPWRGEGRRQVRARSFTAVRCPPGSRSRRPSSSRSPSCTGSSPRSCPRTGSSASKGRSQWSETNLVQTIAHWPGGRAWYRVHKSRLGERVRERTVADMIEQARAAGAVVREEPPYTSVLVQASVTQTLAGSRSTSARASWARRVVYAAGADVGGIATGGYSSGLAAALVLGRIAAEEAVS